MKSLSQKINEALNESKSFKNKKNFERFLMEIDSMRESQIREIMGDSYIDTPGGYRDEKSHYSGIIDYMKSNMGSEDFEYLKSYWENQVMESLSQKIYEALNEVSINESADSNALINKIKTVAEKLEVFHHNTKKFSNHIAFDRIGEELSDLRDELIEKLIGYTGDRYNSTIIGEIVYTDSTGQELVTDIRELGESLIAYAQSTGYQDIENLGQSVHGLSARLNYLLTLNEAILESVNEAADIKSDKEFKDYAETVMKKAHGDDYDQAIVDKMVADILKDADGDYGQAVGQLTSGLGEDLHKVSDVNTSGDGVAYRTK